MKWVLVAGLIINSVLFVVDYFMHNTHSMIFHGVILLGCLVLTVDHD